MTPTDRAARIAEITRRHEKTTPGEWDYDGEIVWINVPVGDPEHHTGNFDIYAADSDPDAEYPDESVIIGNINGHIASGRANAEFLSAAHQDVPWLLADSARLQAELAASEARAREARKLALEEAAKWLDDHHYIAPAEQIRRLK